MSAFDQLRVDIDAAEKASNDALQAAQTALNTANTQNTAYVSTIADLRAQIAALQPKPSILWGSSVMPYTPEKPADALARVETQLAPSLIRDFTPGTGGPVWPTDLGGHRLVISWKIPPAQVLDGSHDAQIKAWAMACPAQYTAASPVYASYWHEPEDNIEAGAFTAAQYRAAWQRIAGIIKSTGKPIRLVLILMEFTLRASTRNWLNYYPGGAYIDVLGWDCYYRPGRTPADVYSRPRSVSAAAGKPWAVCETAVGSTEVTDPVQRRTALTALAHDAATVTPLPEFVTYFDSDPGTLPGYGWNISRDPAAAAAWIAGRVV